MNYEDSGDFDALLVEFIREVFNNGTNKRAYFIFSRMVTGFPNLKICEKLYEVWNCISATDDCFYIKEETNVED